MGKSLFMYLSFCNRTIWSCILQCQLNSYFYVSIHVCNNRTVLMFLCSHSCFLLRTTRS
ncbi:hypothetical protein GBAR_LOCUS9536 [Geodia barretti]|uniref:Uncharacterized protein n=1 Tax=Geodia barretti TaxID=519541 RepID=A0AA35WIV1_GEOBA|nr:hypothetical protein GBAR_LOCUS9536 [Geodia barretti]